MPLKLDLKDIHLPTLLLSLFISIAGIFFIYSTTYNSNLSDLFIKQIIWLALALFACVLILNIDYHELVRLAPIFYLILVITLALLLLVGKLIGGAKSWFFFEHVAIQPSEFGKIIIILYIAKYIAELDRPYLKFKDIIKPAVILALPVALIAMQPDLGTALTYIPIYIGIILIARLRFRVLIVLLLLLAIIMAVSWLYVLKPYQKERITTFMEPENYKKGAGYQIYQSKIAIGSGGFWGKGYLKGTQSQLKFVPEQHSDYIFSVLAEETGLFGVAIAMTVYLLLFISFINTAMLARDRVGLFIATGFVFLFGFHFIINTGMVVGLIPTTGIPLPLMSYGGSSLLTFYIGIGIMMSIRSRRFVYMKD